MARYRHASKDLRLESLLEASKALAPLPAHHAAARDRGDNRVHECQTPVFLFVELDATGVHLFADVPRESPTVRGFVSLLAKGIDGATPAQVAAVPNDLLEQLGLGEALGMTRTHGLHAVLARVKAMVARLAPPA